MNSSFRIFRVFGISVELHITFLLFLVLIASMGAANVVFWLCIFAVVLLHELIHSLVAMGFGIIVPKITLTPIGGLASIEVPEDPKKELLISISGPMSNFVLAAVIYAVFMLSGMSLQSYGNVLDGLSTGSAIITDPAVLLSGMLWVNLLLGSFNIIPGFPMDGGRVFRAVLALWMDYITATRIAVWVGQIISSLMVIWGIFTLNFWFVIIGIFLYSAGGSELEVVKIKHALRGLTVGMLAEKTVSYVNEATTLADFLTATARVGQNHYPVADLSNKVLGILHLEDLRTLREVDATKVAVKDIMRRHIDILDANLSAEDALGKIMGRDFFLVIDADKKIVGCLTPGSMLSAAAFHKLTHRKTVTQKGP